MIELDKHFWLPGTTPTPTAEWTRKLTELIAGDHWIVDGDLGPYDDLPIRLTAADTVIVLDLSLLRCAWRAVQRSRERADFWRWLICWRRRSRPVVLEAVARHAPPQTCMCCAVPSRYDGSWPQPSLVKPTSRTSERARTERIFNGGRSRRLTQQRDRVRRQCLLESLESLDHAAARLQRVRSTRERPIRWATAGGWALDLFLGRVTRDHEDLEIAVLNDDVPAVLDAFAGADWRWNVPTDGLLHPLDSPAYTQTHQTWLWSQNANAFVLDVFREKHDGDTWIFRRDPTITMTWSDVADTSASGTPYLIPQVVLLFKAKHARPKDLADLTTVLPSLNAAQRGWLRASIEQVHPRHDWITRI